MVDLVGSDWAWRGGGGERILIWAPGKRVIYGPDENGIFFLACYKVFQSLCYYYFKPLEFRSQTLSQRISLYTYSVMRKTGFDQQFRGIYQYRGGRGITIATIFLGQRNFHRIFATTSTFRTFAIYNLITHVENDLLVISSKKKINY